MADFQGENQMGNELEADFDNEAESAKNRAGDSMRQKGRDLLNHQSGNSGGGSAPPGGPDTGGGPGESGGNRKMSDDMNGKGGTGGDGKGDSPDNPDSSAKQDPGKEDKASLKGEAANSAGTGENAVAAAGETSSGTGAAAVSGEAAHVAASGTGAAAASGASATAAVGTGGATAGFLAAGGWIPVAIIGGVIAVGLLLALVVSYLVPTSFFSTSSNMNKPSMDKEITDASYHSGLDFALTRDDIVKGVRVYAKKFGGSITGDGTGIGTNASATTVSYSVDGIANTTLKADGTPDFDTPESLARLACGGHQLPLDYVPPNLVEVEGGQRLRKEAAEALQKMSDACAAATGLHLYVNSGYRDPSMQGGAGQASAGYSEHQLGLAADLGAGTGWGDMYDLGSSPAYGWLKANAANFGFLLSYPENNDSGVGWEPWHWRFVGQDLAKVVQAAIDSGATTRYDLWAGTYGPSTVITRTTDNSVSATGSADATQKAAASAGAAASGGASQADPSRMTISADEFDTICAIVNQECNNSYEGSLAVITCVVNRIATGGWNSPAPYQQYLSANADHQADPMSILTANYQFEGYFDGHYLQWKNGNYSADTKQACIDCLVNGKRNHNFVSFRARWMGFAGQDIGGNTYFDAVTADTSNILYNVEGVTPGAVVSPVGSSSSGGSTSYDSYFDENGNFINKDPQAQESWDLLYFVAAYDARHLNVQEGPKNGGSFLSELVDLWMIWTKNKFFEIFGTNVTYETRKVTPLTYDTYVPHEVYVAEGGKVVKKTLYTKEAATTAVGVEVPNCVPSGDFVIDGYIGEEGNPVTVEGDKATVTFPGLAGQGEAQGEEDNPQEKSEETTPPQSLQTAGAKAAASNEDAQKDSKDAKESGSAKTDQPETDGKESGGSTPAPSGGADENLGEITYSRAATEYFEADGTTTTYTPDVDVQSETKWVHGRTKSNLLKAMDIDPTAEYSPSVGSKNTDGTEITYIDYIQHEAAEFSKIFDITTNDINGSSSSANMAGGMVANGSSGANGWVWPIDMNVAGGPFTITSGIGSRESPGGVGSTNHQGTDIGIPNGTALVAVTDGVTITCAGEFGGFGFLTEYQTPPQKDGHSYLVRYGHCTGATKSVGQTANKNEIIAFSGGGNGDWRDGWSTGPHLHFEVHQDGVVMNPLDNYGDDIRSQLVMV